MTVLILGDSITEGAIASGNHGWAQRLAAAHPEREIVVRGVGGDTIENIQIGRAHV